MMKEKVRTIYQNYSLRQLQQRLQSFKENKWIPVSKPSGNLSAKYGLLQYTYIGREGYWCNEVNIGDYIQSIAARQFLPQVDAFVERDAIAAYEGEPVRVIMNGWWHIFKGNAVPSEKIKPLYVSIHITNPHEVPPEMIEHMKRYELIGCRDYSTMNFLKSKGVDAYFSGCMTLTLGKTYSVLPERKTDAVYYVNFDPNIFVNYVKSKTCRTVGFTSPSLRKRLRNIINMFFPDFARYRHIYRDHSAPFALSEQDRFRLADLYLRDYAQAKLVITTKIHCALPCAGMGTPVLLIMQNSQDARFGGIKELLNHLGADTNGEIIQHLFMPSGTTGLGLGSSPDIPAIVQVLSEKCQNFVSAEK